MNSKIILIIILTLVLTACLKDTGSVVVESHSGSLKGYSLENATLVKIKISSTTPPYGSYTTHPKEPTL